MGTLPKALNSGELFVEKYREKTEADWGIF